MTRVISTVPKIAWEHSALAVRLARILEQELAPARKVDAGLAGQVELVGRVGALDVGQGQRLLRPVGRGQHQLVAGVLGVERADALAQRVVALGEARRLGLDLPGGAHVGRRVLAGLQLERAQLQPPGLEVVVDVADRVGLELAPLLPALPHGAVMLLELRPGRLGPLGDRLVADLEGDGLAVEAAPGQPLDDEHPGRLALLDELGVVDEREVLPRQLEVARAEQPAAVARRGRVGRGLLARDLAGQHAAVGQAQLDDRAGPEGGQPLHDDQAEQADDHEQRHGERAAGEPDHRLAVRRERRGARAAARAGPLAPALRRADRGGRRRAAHSS
jgi:hypothetical protein